MGEWTKAAHVSLRAVLDVLDGDIGVLPDAFVFSETPQGFDFWQCQMEARELNSEGREELEHLLLLAEERLASVSPDPASTMKEVREVLGKLAAVKIERAVPEVEATDPWPGSRVLFGYDGWELTVGDVRHARALLSKLGGE